MYWKDTKGSLEVITGPMFAGKSAELIKRLTILKIAQVKFLVFKPDFDTRFGNDVIVSRTGSNVKAISIARANDIWKYWDDQIKAIAFDEVHFFDEGIFEVVEKLISKGVRVIVSGLDMDFAGKSFLITSELLAQADYVSKLKAVCMKCFEQASLSYRKVKSKERHLLGDSEYEARCRQCHKVE
ncbi:MULTISPECIES: thymidine kinase [unclassified Mycoplasma]|uniref:thymidine kinase n=1 Tax=unclassified Mycoplasma TaxID=2683645 RepID=UPI00211CA1D7|nr:MULTISPECIES: thymidine kinase [unclassified Mycoplasma]UUM19980.1 thymidine kinase [Mycoplasma sp. 1578d]UUM24961.1 thymidine kinase [Mycoplasma sp. 3686d]